MNAEKLLTYVRWLLNDEAEFDVQGALEKLRDALANFAAQPQQSTYQLEVASTLEELDKAVVNLTNTYDAVQLKSVLAIGAEPYFTESLIRGIRDQISQNQMTPTIVHKYVSNIVNQRSSYIDHLKAVREGLTALHIEPDRLDDGTAEIGFQLPRDLFNNELDGLVKELRFIRRIINAFSEIVAGAAEPIEVKQISTTDPIFYFGISAIVIAQLGDAVTWALAQWKSIEDIRKVRAETKNLKVFGSADIKGFFDTKIQETIDKAIADKTTEILGPVDGQVGRKMEQRTDIAWALASILARVERGMTVEIRFLAPARELEEGQDLNEKQKQEDQIFDKLQLVTKQLAFPSTEPNPVLTIPEMPSKDEGDETVEKKAPARRTRAVRKKAMDSE